MIYFNGNIKETYYNGNTIRRVYSCGGNLVWTRYNKLIATYSNGSKNYVFCNESQTLSETEVKPSNYNYSAMTKAVIEDCVTTIGNNAFSGCSNLANVSIPNSVTSIGSSAFGSCYNLRNINIPNSVTSIGSSAFTSCLGLTSVGASGSGASIKIPTGVTSIGNSVFKSCEGLTSVTIPNSVTTIGNNAFYFCVGLTNLTIGNGVTTIGSNAFNFCIGLTNLTIGNGVTTIGGSAFQYCKSLTSIDIPDSVTSIGNMAFNQCRGLTSVTIGSGVTSIGSSAFESCSGLTSITVNALTPPTLGNNTFDNTNDCPIYVPCQSLEAYKAAWSAYESRIQCVTPPTFQGKWFARYADSYTESAECDSTSAITMQEITHYNILASIEIGDCVTSIANSCFILSNNTLTSVTMPNTITNIGSQAFYNCSGLTSIDIPSGVTSIGEDAFSGCKGLTSFNIPSGVTSISDGVLYGCRSLTSVTIPNNVISIGENAFENCSGLTYITIEAVTPPTLVGRYYSDAFTNTNDCPIYVPDASVNAYKTATNWSDYASRIYPISEKP